MFMIIHIKSANKFYDKMFKRVYGGIMKCATPFPYVPFKNENEQPTTNILTVDAVLYVEIKKMSNMLK